MLLADDPRCSNGTGSAAVGATAGGETSSSTRLGKKQKHDKVPQRGLGVAELERILRDQQKSSTAAQPSCDSASVLIIQPPHVLPHRPLHALGPAPESGSLFNTPAVPIPPSPAASAAMILGPLPHPRGPNVGGLMDGLQGAATDLWSHYQTALPEVGIPGLPHSPALPHYSDGFVDPVWSAHGYGKQRGRSPAQQRHQQKQPPSTLPLVSATVSPSNSGANLQMEPPSNQTNNISSNSTTCLLPPWPEEERIGGIRPPWSFPFGSLPGYSYHPCKLPLFPRSEEVPSIEGLDALKFPSRGSNTGDGTASSSAALLDGLKASYPNDKSTKENGSAKDEPFPGTPVPPHLTQPSTAAANPSNFSVAPQLMPASSDNKVHGLPEIGSLHSFYAHLDATFTPHFTRQLQTTHYYDFFPMKVDAFGTASTKQDGTPADQIDLELKL